MKRVSGSLNGERQIKDRQTVRRENRKKKKSRKN